MAPGFAVTPAIWSPVVLIRKKPAAETAGVTALSPVFWLETKPRLVAGGVGLKRNRAL
jgi:hypothetical protein